MTHVTFDHAYVSVLDMDRAVRFYEDLLEQKVSNREEDTWADFDLGEGCYFGLINSDLIEERRVVGNNAIVVFSADDVDLVFKKVQKYNVRLLFPPKDLDFTDYPYRCFQCEDTEGNIIEIAKYERK